MSANERMLLWSIHETAGVDSAWARLEDDRLTADGRIAALRPRPHWATYRLETAGAWVTSRLAVETRWEGGSASLDLRREDGRWTVNGDERPDLDRALDCDLAGCPLTNTMPVLRHRLIEDAGDHELRMAFVEVPSLRVRVSVQRYTHLRRLDDGSAVVRYRSGSFMSDLTIDPDGFVIDYPGLGRRLEAPRAEAADRVAGPGSARRGTEPRR